MRYEDCSSIYIQIFGRPLKLEYTYVCNFSVHLINCNATSNNNDNNDKNVVLNGLNEIHNLYSIQTLYLDNLIETSKSKPSLNISLPTTPFSSKSSIGV